MALSADLVAFGSGPRYATVAGASPQAGAVTDSSQESVAVPGPEPGLATEVETVDAGGPPEVGTTAVGALRGPAAGVLAATAGPTGAADRQPGCGSVTRSPSATGSGATDDPSWRGAGGEPGFCGDPGSGGTLCRSAASGQLLRSDSAGALQRGPTAVGRHQQTGQLISALLAGAGRARRRPLGSRAATVLRPLQTHSRPRRSGQGGSGPQAGGAVVLDVARSHRLCRVDATPGTRMQVSPSHAVVERETERLSGQPASPRTGGGEIEAVIMVQPPR